MSTEKKNCYEATTENTCSILFACAVKVLFCGGRVEPDMNVGEFFGNLQVDGWMAVLQDIGQDSEINQLHDEVAAKANELNEQYGVESDEYRKYCTKASVRLATAILQRYGGMLGLLDARSKTMAAAKHGLRHASDSSMDIGVAIDELAKSLGAKVIRVGGSENPLKDILDTISGAKAAKAAAN